MTRDNVLFILIGILAGFIAGYLMQEVMSVRQPARLVHGQTGAAAPRGGAGGPVGAPRGGAGNTQAAGQDRVEEMRQLQTYVQQNPDDADAILRLANLAYDSQIWELCVASYERYMDLAEPDPDVLSDLGVCYRETGKPGKALEAFERAQDVAPDHWQSRYNEVVILAFDMGEFDRAAEVLDELRELQPDNPDIETLAAEVERRRSS